MPNLKAALQAQQQTAAKLAARRRAGENEKRRAESARANAAGAKKGKKRMRAALREGTAGVQSGENGVKRDPGADGEGSMTATGSGSNFRLIEGVDVQRKSTLDRTVGTQSTLEPFGEPSTSKSFKPLPKASRPTIPFSSSDTILLLGEANFSFALSLILHHAHPPHHLLATSYDTEAMCYEKYPDAAGREGNVARLRGAGVRVEFGVDAGALDRCKAVGKGRRWSRVMFNFPHAGAGIKDQDRNILSNQTLLLRTLRSVHGILTEGEDAGVRERDDAAAGRNRKQKRRRQCGRGGSASTSEDEPEAELSGVSDLEAEDRDNDPYELGAGENDLKAQPADSAILNSERSGPPDPPGSTKPYPKTATPRFTPPSRPGTLLITLLDQPPYTLWGLPKLATRPPRTIPGARPGGGAGPERQSEAQPRYTLVRSFAFGPSAYPGYAHRRTIGYKEGVSRGGNEEIVGRRGGARTWEFKAVGDRDEGTRK